MTSKRIQGNRHEVVWVLTNQRAQRLADAMNAEAHQVPAAHPDRAYVVERARVGWRVMKYIDGKVPS